MVVVDGSPGSENAFEVAASVTDPARPLIVYHAQGFHPVIYMPDAPHVADHASFLNRLAEDKATKIMTHFEQKCRERNRNCLYVSEKSIDQASSVGSAICEYAEDHSVDTVFVGSRGMSTLQRFEPPKVFRCTVDVSFLGLLCTRAMLVLWQTLLQELVDATFTFARCGSRLHSLHSKHRSKSSHKLRNKDILFEGNARM